MALTLATALEATTQYKKLSKNNSRYYLTHLIVFDRLSLVEANKEIHMMVYITNEKLPEEINARINAQLNKSAAQMLADDEKALELAEKEREEHPEDWIEDVPPSSVVFDSDPLDILYSLQELKAYNQLKKPIQEETGMEGIE